jgi:hypothetical protein
MPCSGGNFPTSGLEPGEDTARLSTMAAVIPRPSSMAERKRKRAKRTTPTGRATRSNDSAAAALADSKAHPRRDSEAHPRRKGGGEPTWYAALCRGSGVPMASRPWASGAVAPLVQLEAGTVPAPAPTRQASLSGPHWSAALAPRPPWPPRHAGFRQSRASEALCAPTVSGRDRRLSRRHRCTAQ